MCVYTHTYIYINNKAIVLEVIFCLDKGNIAIKSIHTLETFKK